MILAMFLMSLATSIHLQTPASRDQAGLLCYVKSSEIGSNNPSGSSDVATDKAERRIIFLFPPKFSDGEYSDPVTVDDPTGAMLNRSVKKRIVTGSKLEMVTNDISSDDLSVILTAADYSERQGRIQIVRTVNDVIVSRLVGLCDLFRSDEAGLALADAKKQPVQRDEQ